MVGLAAATTTWIRTGSAGADARRDSSGSTFTCAGSAPSHATNGSRLTPAAAPGATRTR
jgi:hypothetical protein